MNTELNEEAMLAFQAKLDQEPQHVERHDDGYDYIPVSAIEDDLAEIFKGLFNITILNSSPIFHGVKYDVRISYYHPVACIWINRDGAGAVSVYLNRVLEGTDVEKLQAINTIEMATPLAYAEAIKNAAKKIGKRFGADLNRDFDSKSRKQKVSAFDVIPFDHTEIKNLHDANKAFTAKQIDYKTLKQLKEIADEKGNIVIPDAFELDKTLAKPEDKKTTATIKKAKK